MDNADIVRSYFSAIEKGVSQAELARFLHPDIRQYEFPSRLNPNGRGRNKDGMLSDFEKGKAIITRQEYRIKSILCDGDRVAAETEWAGVLAIPLGTLKAGDAMRANFGVFFRIKDGMIIEQNNYDCIHPW